MSGLCCCGCGPDDDIYIDNRPPVPPPAVINSDRYTGFYPSLNKPPDQTHQIPYDPSSLSYTHHHPQPPVVCPPSVGRPPIVCPPSIGGPICPPTAPPPVIQVCPPCHSVPGASDDLAWIPFTTDGPIPPNAVRGGTDLDGSDIFVGRSYHEGDVIPAKVIPARSVAYICHGGREVTKYNCEVLVQKQLVWQFASGGNVPEGAVPGGHTSDGETLYIGRVFHEGTQTVGKIHPSHGSCYIPYNGEEVPHSEYEVLVLQ